MISFRNKLVDLIGAKCVFFTFLGRGYIRENLTNLTNLTKTPKEPSIWSINNQVWSSFFSKIDQYISFRMYGLQALVNLVKFSPYTPPVERKQTQIGQVLPFSKAKNLTNR